MRLSWKQGLCTCTLQSKVCVFFIIFVFLLSKPVDLLGRLTVEEKISQLGNTAPSINNLTIPGYQWYVDNLCIVLRCYQLKDLFQVV